MVVIRLQRRGTKKTPHHRIVVTDRSRSQRGRILEVIGHYDPAHEQPMWSLDESRLAFWVSSGAKISAAVLRLVKRFKDISLASAKT